VGISWGLGDERKTEFSSPKPKRAFSASPYPGYPLISSMKFAKVLPSGGTLPVKTDPDAQKRVPLMSVTSARVGSVDVACLSAKCQERGRRGKLGIGG